MHRSRVRFGPVTTIDEVTAEAPLPVLLFDSSTIPPGRERYLYRIDSPDQQVT